MSETKIILEILNNNNQINNEYFNSLSYFLKNKKNKKNKKILNMTIKKLSNKDLNIYNKLANLNNIYSFECNGINLNRFPIMVDVEILKIPNCNLQSMADYYNNLKELNCAFNHLYFLPKIPNCEILNCQYNRITELPENLKNVKELNCSNNNISFLPSLPNCQKLILDGNPIIYYNDEIRGKFNLKISPMTSIVYDYINIKTNLTGIVDITLKKEDRIEYLFEAYFKNEKEFIKHVRKLLLSTFSKKLNIDKNFENHLKQVIDLYKFKNKYIKYKLKYHKLKTKIGGDVES